MVDADGLFAEADYCRRLADEADPLTQRILLELAEQYENEAHLLLVYPPRSTDIQDYPTEISSACSTIRKARSIRLSRAIRRTAPAPLS